MSYLSVDEVESAITNLAGVHSTLTRLLTMPNLSHDRRGSHAICVGKPAALPKESVVIIGGVHAREWGSCDIAVNLVADLLEAYTTNTGLAYGGKSFAPAVIKSLVETRDIVVFPLVNPDGRHEARTNDTQWRGNKNPAAAGGVDLNRNFDFLFDFTTAFAPGCPVSASADPNNMENYHGTAAFSEPETKNVGWLLDQFPKARWFVDLHACGQTVLYGWNDDETQTTSPQQRFNAPAFNGKRGFADATYAEYMDPSDLARVQHLARTLATDIKAACGNFYTAKPSFELYPSSGTSHDYAYSRHISNPAKGKIYSFAVEWGEDWQPSWSDMETIIKEVTAGLIGFCIAA
jgi:murein tripeptide amidase MpaA